MKRLINSTDNKELNKFLFYNCQLIGFSLYVIVFISKFYKFSLICIATVDMDIVEQS